MLRNFAVAGAWSSSICTQIPIVPYYYCVGLCTVRLLVVQDIISRPPLATAAYVFAQNFLIGWLVGWFRP